MVELGVNIHNHEPPLLESDTVDRTLELGESRKTTHLAPCGVWIAFRIDHGSNLGNLTARTDALKLGTGCMITTLRNPVQLLQA